MFLLLLILTITAYVLIRRGTFGPPPPWITGRPSPEAEAKKILSDRFANGEISAEEFMERASVLNWTPGAEQWRLPKKQRR